MKYVQARRATRRAATRERNGGAKGWQIKKLGKPWKNICGEQRFGGDKKGEPRSRNQGKLERHNG